MPIFKNLNKQFFKNWNPNMAYVLGYFAADGCMLKNNRGAHFIEFHSIDKELLERVRNLLEAEHKISARSSISRVDPNWNTIYRLQIGSKDMFYDLLRLGFTPAKSNTINFPQMPPELLSDFIRGYFDGDGHVHAGIYQRRDRKGKSRIIAAGFTSGSRMFLLKLWYLLKKNANIIGGTFYYNKGYRLQFSINDSRNLYNFMYKGSANIFLERKRKIFESYFI